MALSLLHQGKDVQLANLTFSAVEGLPLEDWIAPDLAAITPDTAPHQIYFPERTLAQWLALHGYPSTVHAPARVGVRPLRAAYQALIDRYDIDAVVLVDGGTDILMRGDETGLGTPEEDLASVAALAWIEGPGRLVVSIGFGVDAYHGVSHGLVLENIAALERAGAYLGAFSVPRTTREGALSSTRWPTPRRGPPRTRASSTVPSRLPCGASSGMCSSHHAPKEVSFPSTR